MKRVFYRSLCAVLCVSMLSAVIPVRVIAEEGWRQENTLEQSETGAADNSSGSMTGVIDTSEIDNKSIKNESLREFVWVVPTPRAPAGPASGPST